MDALSAAIPSHLMADPSKDLPKAKNAMGKEDFMKLLMTQLQNQDPLKPMEHQEFAAQLAQFGSLEQLTNIHKGIEGLHTGIGDGAKLSALSLIGKKVQAIGNQLDLLEGQEVGMKYTSKEGVTPVKAAVYTEGGKLVRELDISRAEGAEIKWDGKDQEGRSLPSGKYTFRVQGVDKSGQAQELSTELSGRVTGVEMEGKDPVLVVETGSGKTKLELGRVNQVSIDNEKAEEKSAKPVNPLAPNLGAKVSQNSQNTPVAAASSEGSQESDETMPSISQLDRGVWGGMPGVGGMEGMR